MLIEGEEGRQSWRVVAAAKERGAKDTEGRGGEKSGKEKCMQFCGAASVIFAPGAPDLTRQNILSRGIL